MIMCVFAITTASAQINSVCLVGDAAGGWGDDVEAYQLTKIDADNWKIEGAVLTANKCKLRANGAWQGAGFEWAGAFPTATGTSSGDIIVPVAGVYTVTLNTATSVYNFIAETPIPVVKLIGSAVDGGEITLIPSDTENFSAKVVLLDGTAKFDVDGASFSDSAFPVGIAIENGSDIPVTGAYWLVKFNVATGEYSFETPPAEQWAITGSALLTFGYDWGTDLLLDTTDGITYTSVAPISFEAGAFKFRIAGDWGTARGADAFPIGTASAAGGDIAVTDEQAGLYTLTYNALTGEFTFTKQLSTKGFSSANFKVYPNPTQNVWNFASTSERIESVKIVDVLGKNVMTVSPKSNNVSVDATILTKGIYFAKIATAKATETIKLMKN